MTARYLHLLQECFQLQGILLKLGALYHAHHYGRNNHAYEKGDPERLRLIAVGVIITEQKGATRVQVYTHTDEARAQARKHRDGVENRGGHVVGDKRGDSPRPKEVQDGSTTLQIGHAVDPYEYVGPPVEVLDYVLDHG